MERLCPPRGEARFFHNVRLTRQQIGPLHLALAWPANGQSDPWYVISDEPTDLDTFAEYGLRFDIEENFLDDKCRTLWNWTRALIQSQPGPRAVLFGHLLPSRLWLPNVKFVSQSGSYLFWYAENEP